MTATKGEIALLAKQCERQAMQKPRSATPADCGLSSPMRWALKATYFSGLSLCLPIIISHGGFVLLKRSV